MHKDYKFLWCTAAGQHSLKQSTTNCCTLFAQQENFTTLAKTAKRLAQANKARCTQAHDQAKLPKLTQTAATHCEWLPTSYPVSRSTTRPHGPHSDLRNAPIVCSHVPSCAKGALEQTQYALKTNVDPSLRAHW